ncbi:hypothetical protein AK830_g9408 [Neonectria ditissima]|uniref:Uncharacterized protein n=1 Tax=Neonectria ditissima TaxID=78410 RepID=A0A0P7AUV7_9HYPO|nr:hypothetical protein AK830_g9408 [Neonectria ditissima]
MHDSSAATEAATANTSAAASPQNRLDLDLLLLRPRRHEGYRRSLPTLWNSSLPQLQHPEIQHARQRRASGAQRRERIAILTLAPGVCFLRIRDVYTGEITGRGCGCVWSEDDCQAPPHLIPTVLRTMRLYRSDRQAEGRNLRGWVTAAITTWVDPPQTDAWLARYSPKKSVTDKDENKPWISFKDEYESELSDIRFFINPDARSDPLEDNANRIESFCQGAELDLDTAVTPSGETRIAASQHQTKAWVSDRNSNFQDSNTPFDYDRGLSPRQLFEVLGHKSLPDDPDERNVVPPRRIITDSNSWDGPFIIRMDFPYFALSNLDREDTRPLRGTRKLRRRHDFSFLNPKKSEEEGCDEEPGYRFLYEPTCSFLATGKSEQRWTAICLNEDSFEALPFLDTEDDLETDGLDPDYEDVDPIILEAPFKNWVAPPRTYSLQFADRRFKTMVNHQQIIHQQFKASLSRFSPTSAQDPRDHLSSNQTKEWTTKSLAALSLILYSVSQLRGEWGRFFAEEVVFDQNELPTGRLLQSLRDDRMALKALKNLRNSLNELKIIEQGMEGSKRQFEEIRLQRQNENGDAQRDLSQSVRTLTVFSAASMLQDKLSDVDIGHPTFTEMWSREDDCV